MPEAEGEGKGEGEKETGGKGTKQGRGNNTYKAPTVCHAGHRLGSGEKVEALGTLDRSKFHDLHLSCPDLLFSLLSLAPLLE